MRRTSYGNRAPQIGWQRWGFPTSGKLRLLEQVEHFMSIGDGLTVVTSSLSGAGAAVTAAAAPAGRVGVVDLATGTDTGGRIALITGTSAFVLGTGRHRLRIDASLVDASDGTNTYTARLGYMDSQTGDPTDGCFFRYTHSVNDGEWQAVTRANGVETASAADTGVVLAAGTFRSFEIEVNADATSVAFYIDGVLVATNTANIPSGASRNTGIGAGMVKSAGATSRSMQLDLLAWSHEPTTPA
jgi:hypothetical protein